MDDDLRVYGTKRLRVADASIFPLLVGGTTQLTVYAVAEKVYHPLEKDEINEIS